MLTELIKKGTWRTQLKPGRVRYIHDDESICDKNLRKTGRVLASDVDSGYGSQSEAEREREREPTPRTSKKDKPRRKNKEVTRTRPAQIVRTVKAKRQHRSENDDDDESADQLSDSTARNPKKQRIQNPEGIRLTIIPKGKKATTVQKSKSRAQVYPTPETEPDADDDDADDDADSVDPGDSISQRESTPAAGVSVSVGAAYYRVDDYRLLPDDEKGSCGLCQRPFQTRHCKYELLNAAGSSIAFGHKGCATDPNNKLRPITEKDVDMADG